MLMILRHHALFIHRVFLDVVDSGIEHLTPFLPYQFMYLSPPALMRLQVHLLGPVEGEHLRGGKRVLF